MASFGELSPGTRRAVDRHLTEVGEAQIPVLPFASRATDAERAARSFEAVCSSDELETLRRAVDRHA